MEMVKCVRYCFLMIIIEKFKVYIKQCYLAVRSIERIQKVKIKKLQRQKTED